MILLRTASLLIVSNIFMTFAWYGHLRHLGDRKWYIAAVLSWGIALFEYMFMIPANRIGATELTLSQLKILQEAITLLVFLPFAVFYMRQAPRLDFLWAGLCIVGAVFFMFRGHSVELHRPDLRVLPERPHRVEKHYDATAENRPLHAEEARRRASNE
jgi:uncharacterized protein (DUF486 family)